MTPTSDSSNPSAHTISVADGNSETMRGVALLTELRLVGRPRRSLVVITDRWDDGHLPGGRQRSAE